MLSFLENCNDVFSLGKGDRGKIELVERQMRQAMLSQRSKQYVGHHS